MTWDLSQHYRTQTDMCDSPMICVRVHVPVHDIYVHLRVYVCGCVHVSTCVCAGGGGSCVHGTSTVGGKVATGAWAMVFSS